MTAKGSDRETTLDPRSEEEEHDATDARGDGGGEPRAEAGVDADAAEAAQSAPGDEVAAEAQAERDRYLRLAAEYDNFRKRTDRERAESWTRAQAQLVEQLIDPLDDLQRVVEHSGEGTTREALLEGVELVERKLLRALESAGLEVVDPAGETFNPERHEAVMRLPAESEAEDDTVAQVFQKGYQFKGVLLRPARVQVRKFE